MGLTSYTFLPAFKFFGILINKKMCLLCTEGIAAVHFGLLLLLTIVIQLFVLLILQDDNFRYALFYRVNVRVRNKVLYSKMLSEEFTQLF